jgi:hypothetical protein
MSADSGPVVKKDSHAVPAPFSSMNSIRPKGPEQKPAYAADCGNNKKRAEAEEKSALHDPPCSA